jgi:hypothetical protein
MFAWVATQRVLLAMAIFRYSEAIIVTAPVLSEIVRGSEMAAT